MKLKYTGVKALLLFGNTANVKRIESIAVVSKDGNVRLEIKSVKDGG